MNCKGMKHAGAAKNEITCFVTIQTARYWGKKNPPHGCGGSCYQETYGMMPVMGFIFCGEVFWGAWDALTYPMI